MRLRLDPLATNGISVVPPIAPVIVGGGGSNTSTGVQAVIAGANVTVDNTDPTRPIVASSAAGGGGGTVTNVSSATADATVTSPTTTPVITVVSAPKLTTARNINGVAFDGTANITVADATKEPIITAGTTAQYYRGDKSFQTLDKTAVGLANVDNTSDATKAVLSATKWTTARNLAGNSTDGSANVAFANKFIVQGTTDTGLSAAQFLGALGTGILKNTTTTGVLSIAVAADFPTLNQNTTGSAGSLSADIPESRVTNLVSDLAAKQASLSLTTTGTSGAATLVGATLNIPQYAGGSSSGIVRSISTISTPTTAGATAATDYVYFVSGTTTLTLPTAVGNTNLYTIKNTGSAVVTVATTSAQTIDGSATASLPVQYTSIDVISDGANWNVI